MSSEKQFFEEHLGRVDAAAAKLQKTLALLGDEHSEEIKDRMIEALGSELHQLYTGFEELSKTLLRAQNIYVKKSESHHQILLEYVFERIIPADETLQAFWADLLAFRHFYRNAYGRELRPGEIAGKAREATVLWPETKGHFLKAAKTVFSAET
jgi:hypothetical protein